MACLGASARSSLFQPIYYQFRYDTKYDLRVQCTKKGNIITFKGEKHKESKFILLFARVVDVAEEAEVIETFHGVVIVCHDVGVGVADVT